MTRPLDQLRVAIVHEWFQTYAGSERVVEQMLNVLPHADLFGLVDFLPPGGREFIRNKPVTTSFIQRLPFARRGFRKYLGLMPRAVEQFDLRPYDLVISSSHAVAKGVLTSADQLHVCMCYSPMRYAWDMYQDYLDGAGLRRGLRGWFARRVLHRLRLWDRASANGVDRFIAISKFIAGRIRKTYRRGSKVIYPPVDVQAFSPGGDRGDFYLAASRLVPYKRMDLIVQAFAKMPQRQLVVIGEGSEIKRLQSLAGPNVKLLGAQPHASLVSHMQRAKAFLFAAREDFGIVPVEAQACGTPVIAFAAGGSAETVVDGTTGLLFHEQTPESLIAAIESFETRAGSFSPAACRANAERFSIDRFRREFTDFLAAQWQRFERRRQ